MTDTNIPSVVDLERAGHDSSVSHLPGTRYPWLPVCSCGARFRGYASERAARLMAASIDAHELGPRK